MTSRMGRGVGLGGVITLILFALALASAVLWLGPMLGFKTVSGLLPIAYADLMPPLAIISGLLAAKRLSGGRAAPLLKFGFVPLGVLTALGSLAILILPSDTIAKYNHLHLTAGQLLSISSLLLVWGLVGQWTGDGSVGGGGWQDRHEAKRRLKQLDALQGGGGTTIPIAGTTSGGYRGYAGGYGPSGTGTYPPTPPMHQPPPPPE